MTELSSKVLEVHSENRGEVGWDRLENYIKVDRQWQLLN